MIRRVMELADERFSCHHLLFLITPKLFLAFRLLWLKRSEGNELTNENKSKKPSRPPSPPPAPVQEKAKNKSKRSYRTALSFDSSQLTSRCLRQIFNCTIERERKKKLETLE